MGLELTTDKYPPITSQTRYPLRHAADMLNIDKLLNVTDAHTDYIAISITLGHVLTA